MSHFKCVACNVRLYAAGGPGHRVAALVGDRCPRCGHVLEPVGASGESLGVPASASCENVADGAASDRRAQVADCLRDVFAGRTVIDAQTWLDAERWFDDGGDVRAEASRRAGSQAGT
jgi:hypothetical protein